MKTFDESKVKFGLQSIQLPPGLILRPLPIMPDGTIPSDALKLARSQANPVATAQEIHDGLQATLDAHQPAKRWTGPRNVTGTREGGDIQIIGAGPPPDEPPPAQ